MPRSALVTGGAGFIGSHLARRLVAEGWRVHVVDNLSTGSRDNVPDGTVFRELDLSREESMAGLPDEPIDAVFHLAAQSSGEISFDDPAYDLRANCLSTLLLLDWCARRGTERFMYTSSMSVYGDGGEQAVAESVPPAPKSHYGVGKMASERYCAIYGAQRGLATTSLRLFNVYGPGQNLANLRQGMVSIYLAYLLQSKTLPVKGSPERYRDFVFIEDVVDAYMACLDEPASHGKAFNVAFGRRTLVRELVRALLEAMGLDPDTYPVEYAGSTPGDTFGIFADVSAIAADVGWRPKVPLEDGLERMVAWARQPLPHGSTGT